jgi:hypothetical protein
MVVEGGVIGVRQFHHGLLGLSAPMGSAAGLAILLLLGAPAPQPEADERPRAGATEAPDTLKEVPFTPRALPAPARLVVAPDLRDPFRDGPPPRSGGPQPEFGHGDLKDPFRGKRAPPPVESPPADLRDPFGPDREGPRHCAPATTDGVEIQRPKQLECPRSSAGPASTRYAGR